MNLPNTLACDDYKQTLSRRRILKNATLAGLGGLFAAASQSALSQTFVRTKGTNGNVLINVFLRGGCDALNTIVPHADDDYYRARPSLGIPAPKSGLPENRRATDLDGFFGINPAMLPLLGHWKDGSLAFVHAVGSGDESHSHFEAMNTMERGLNSQNDRLGGGWLSRHLNMTQGSPSPLRAVSLTSTMPDSLLGAIQAVAIESMSDYRITTENTALARAVENLYRDQTTKDELRQAGFDTWQVLKALTRVDPNDYRPDGNAAYPESPVGKAFRETAFLIKQDLGMEVACIDAGGWDSHVTQGTTEGWLYELLKDMADSIAAFTKDMGKEMSRITILVQSEFGRRVGENSGLGTDHGTGGAMWLLGGGVQGGKVYGRWPRLVPDKLVGPGDLQTTSDYRDVLSEILESRLGNPDSGQVFPNYRRTKIGVLA
ncbi:DUF1501 domain-containing protein [Kamptonema cortianum]|nr:DUF1501 domain-containing protein [Geitlerinema splendidum]MDK3158784.1 DUF1501 domain-containing protein [Kamptonema cortianum]